MSVFRTRCLDILKARNSFSLLTSRRDWQFSSLPELCWLFNIIQTHCSYIWQMVNFSRELESWTSSGYFNTRFLRCTICKALTLVWQGSKKAGPNLQESWYKRIGIQNTQKGQAHFSIYTDSVFRMHGVFQLLWLSGELLRCDWVFFLSKEK